MSDDFVFMLFNNMTICLSFVGKTPSYLVDNIRQIRYFTDDDVYIILSELQSTIVDTLNKINNVFVIDYNNVKSKQFDDLMIKYRQKFKIIHGLNDRKELFIRSFERFYILYELMLQRNFTDVWFLELDNTIYDDPNNWLSQLKDSDMAYLLDNNNRCCAGIAYFRNVKTLNHLLDHFTQYIQQSNDKYLNEMTALYTFYKNTTKTKVYILPSHWENEEYSTNFQYYNEIFDAHAIGVYLFGLDTFHTSGKIKKHCKDPWSKIDYTQNNFKWIKDDKERYIPHIQNGDTWIKINNLHVHSKLLSEALSK